MPLIYSIIAPLLIISSVAVYQGEAFTAIETARLLQNCMLIAGIGTLLQLYPIWKIGSGLPVVMGISFTFLAACLATASQDYGIMVGALAMILGGLFPPIGAFFTTLPDCVLGGCTVIMFGSIMMSGVRMMHDAGMDQRNTLIAATSICLGVGVTQVDGFFNELPSFIGDIFRGQYGRGRVRRGPDPRSVSATRPQPLYQHATQIFGIQKRLLRKFLRSLFYIQLSAPASARRSGP